MKNITQVLYSGLGGHGSVAFSLIEGDIKHQAKHNLVFFGIEPVKDEYIEKCKKYKIPYGAIVISGMSKLKSLWNAFRAIKRQQPDIIILHSTVLFLLVPFWRIMGIKIISVDHTPNSTKTSREWLDIHLLRYFSNIQVYLTELQYKDYETRFGKKYHQKGHPVIINNGLNTQLFSSSKSYDQMSSYKLLMQARFSWSKDFQTFIKAAKILKDRHFFDFHVYLAGDGEKKEECVALSNSLHLENEVTFLGMLSEDKLIEHLQSTYLYIHSSLSETMSTAIMQAMACGLPCLVSDIDGNKAIIEDGINGWVFKTGDEQELAKKIEVLLALPEQMAKMSLISRDYAEKNFSQERMFEEYFRLVN
ncbi:MAG: glycosyltransferase [Chitinophagales bacterium]|nr:glycosyltransferase [Chitinophagales bacterium]MCZ2393911.1 glycosyltransferase [Chitinophagales bacterium]